MRRTILLVSLASSLIPALAEECRVLHPVPPQGEQLSWKGACRNGLADGPGEITVSSSGKPGVRYEVTLADGEIVGEGMMHFPDGQLYAGTFQKGRPHGYGFFRYANGSKYKGGVVDGLPEGEGTWTSRDGSRYVGQWRAGKKEGKGRVDFALGGSYEGGWLDDGFYGAGVLTYAGSGRKVESKTGAEWALALARPVVAAPSDNRYGLKENSLRTGTNIRRAAVHSAAPSDRSYADLTPEQQAIVRNAYAALAPGDEPPYPLNGPKELYTAIVKALGRVGDRSELTLLVRVGADGAAKSVSAVGSPTPELLQFAATAVMLQKYKPAVCDGTPCEMMYPFSFKFDLDHGL